MYEVADKLNIKNMKKKLKLLYTDRASNFISIKLTIKQFLYFGIHLGHKKKNLEFLAGWIFYGWKHNIFIINLIKTIILTKTGLRVVRSAINADTSFWFVSMNSIYGPYLARYAYLSGEPFNIYNWISGTLCNFRNVMGWNKLLTFLYHPNKTKVRHKDKKTLLTLYGMHSNSSFKIFKKKRRFLHIEKLNNEFFNKRINNYLDTIEKKKRKKYFNLNFINKQWFYNLNSFNYFGHRHVRDELVKAFKAKELPEKYYHLISKVKENKQTKIFKIKKKDSYNKKLWFAKKKLFRNMSVYKNKFIKIFFNLYIKDVVDKKREFLYRFNKKVTNNSFYNSSAYKEKFLMRTDYNFRRARYELEHFFIKDKFKVSNYSQVLKSLEDKKKKNFKNFLLKNKKEKNFFLEGSKFYNKLFKNDVNMSNETKRTILSKVRKFWCKNLLIHYKFFSMVNKNKFINNKLFINKYNINYKVGLHTFSIFHKKILTKSLIPFLKFKNTKGQVNVMRFSKDKPILQKQVYLIQNMLKKGINFESKKLEKDRKRKKRMKEIKETLLTQGKEKKKNKFFLSFKHIKKNLLNTLSMKKSKSIIYKKLALIKFIDKSLYKKINHNLKFLYSNINWNYFNKIKKVNGQPNLNEFFRYYSNLQNKVLSYYFKNTNFKYLDYFLMRLNYLKNKKDIYNNSIDLYKEFNLKTKDNKLKIYKYKFNINFFKDDNKNKKLYNFIMYELNLNKLVQKKIILNFLNKENKIKFLKRFKNERIFLQKYKNKIKKKFLNRRVKESYKLKKPFYLDYKKKGYNNLKERSIFNFNNKHFFKVFLFKKNKIYYRMLRYVGVLKKWTILKKLTTTRKKFIQKQNFPGGGFVPTVRDNPNIIDEFSTSNVPFISLIDSNVRSVGVFIPIPSNDDSIQCVNFFLFLISKAIILIKALKLKKFVMKIKKKKSINYLNNNYKFVFLTFLKKNVEVRYNLDKNESKNWFYDHLYKYFLFDYSINYKNFGELIINEMFLKGKNIYSYVDSFKLQKEGTNFKYYTI